MSEYDDVPVHKAGKRLGLQWAPHGDWFVSWSPRNSNSNAEGQWDQWVDLAIAILADPLTGKTRPGAQAAVQHLETQDFYSEVGIELTEADLAERFLNGA